MSHRLTSLISPLLPLLVFLYVGIYADQLPELWFRLLTWAPVILGGSVLLLSLHFKNGRAFLVILLLFGPKLSLLFSDGAIPPVFLAIIFLNLMLICHMQERGLFNRFALNRQLFILMQLAWGWAVVFHWIQLPALDGIVFGLSWSLWLYWLTVSFSLLLVIVKWWAQGENHSTSTMVSMLALLLAQHASLNDSQIDSMYSAAFLVWIVSLLSDSYRMAYLDELTGVPARRAFNEKLKGLSRRFAIAMVDVDHFKKVNDTYGHDMGDLVLKRVAQSLKAIGANGQAFRYGGEEFAIVFHGQQRDLVKEALEHIREQIAEMEVSVFDGKQKRDKDISVTVSLGCAFADPGEAPEAVIKKADQCLYKAKKQGRNRLILS